MNTKTTTTHTVRLACNCDTCNTNATRLGKAQTAAIAG